MSATVKYKGNTIATLRADVSPDTTKATLKTAGKYCDADIEVENSINLQTKSATPTTQTQTILPSQSYDGLSVVVVNPVTSAIDSNIVAGNIKKGTSILGVNGSYGNFQSKNATPTTSQQTITAGSGYDALSQVVVGAVTSSIDSNIKAENIKQGITILGVLGTLSGGGGGGGLPSDITELKTGTFTTPSVNAVITINPGMGGQPLFGLCWDDTYNGVPNGPLYFLHCNSPSFKAKAGVRGTASTGTLTYAVSVGNLTPTSFQMQGGGASWYAFQPGHTYKWVCWR